MNANLDDQGYPTEAALARIRDATTATAALDALTDAWNETYGTVREWLRWYETAIVGGKPGQRFLRLSTGGWSGNEDALGCLDAIVTAGCWRLSAAGGLHIWRYPDPEVRPEVLERARLPRRIHPLGEDAAFHVDEPSGSSLGQRLGVVTFVSPEVPA